MIAQRFETYVSSRNLGPSPREVHHYPKKLIFPQGTIMSPERRRLNCFSFPKEQSCHQGEGALFPKNMVAHWGNLDLVSFGNVVVPLGNNLNLFLPWEFVFIHFVRE